MSELKIKLEFEVVDVTGKITVGYSEMDEYAVATLIEGIEDINMLTHFSMPVIAATSGTKVYFNPTHIVSITIRERQ